jgi:hypothetical protein
MSDGRHVEAIERAVARDEIRQLAYRYASVIERRNVDAMVDLFVPHARFGAYGEGADALRRLMHDGTDGLVFAVILIANHLIEVEGPDRATGEVWARCFAQTDQDGFVEQLIKYEDRYERHEGRWLFLHRRHRLWYGVAHRDSPLRQEAAEWPARQVGVGDVPLDDPRFLAWWRSRV